jgi:membrane protease subunit HflC
MKNSQMLVVAIAALVLLALVSSFFVVDQRERVVLFQFGEIQGTDYEPGLHFKVPFVQSVMRFDGRVLTLDNQTENFLTVEKKNVEVDYFVKWRIADTTTYYRATGGQDIVAMDRLSAIVNRGLRDQFGSRTVQQVVSGERDEILQSLQKNAADAVKDLGIQMVDVRVKRVDLPKDVSDSVYERMRAERTRVASDLRARGAEEAEKIRAEADREAQTSLANAYRDAEKLRGEGDAKASEIYAAAYGQDQEFYNFYRSLGVYRDAFASKQNIMVLQPEGELFKYFKKDAPAP